MKTTLLLLLVSFLTGCVTTPTQPDTEQRQRMREMRMEHMGGHRPI